MQVIIWVVTVTTGVVLALMTGRGDVGPAGWLVLTLVLAGACCRPSQIAVAVPIWATAGVISMGVIARDDLLIGVATGLIALLLIGLSSVVWRRAWRRQRREIVHHAIDQQLIPVDTLSLALAILLAQSLVRRL